MAACVAPRPLVLINTVNQRKQRREEQAVRQDYALTSSIYKFLDAEKNFRAISTDSAPETLAEIKGAV